MFNPEDFKLSFSTWAAPDLTIEQLAETARACGYSGIELRMPSPDIEPHAHGVTLEMAPTQLAEARQALADAGVEIDCLATGLVFGGDEAANADAVEELKRHVTLAESLGCRCVRVFGGGLSADEGEIAGAVDAVSDGLSEGVEFAEQSNIIVLLETLGDFSSTKYVREAVKQVYSEHFGVLWDVAQTFRVLETVEEAYDNIAGKVRHVHVQDFRYVDGRTRTEPALLGEGVVPFGSAVRYLAHDGYEGYLSVETRVGPAGVGDLNDVLPQHAQVLHGLITEAFPEPVEAEQESASS